MIKWRQYVGIIFLCATALVIIHHHANAQFERADSIARTFPEELPEFETDAPLIIHKQAKQQSNLTVSIIYYRIDGSEQVRLMVEDFKLNSGYFDRQYNRVKEQMNSPENPQYYYKDYQKQERREENNIEQVIYLDKKLIFTITHSGTIRDTQLSDKILRHIDLQQIR